MNLFQYLTHDTQMMKESFSNKLVPKWESLLEENQENPSNMEIIIRFRQIDICPACIQQDLMKVQKKWSN